MEDVPLSPMGKHWQPKKHAEISGGTDDRIRVNHLPQGSILAEARFPSKLTALQVSCCEKLASSPLFAKLPQFEWAWQNPDKSRHLRSHDTNYQEGQYIFKRDAGRNRVERKAM